MPLRDDSIDRCLARNLKSIREARGLTQTELARRVGANRTQIAGFERNDRPMMAKELQGLAGALDADIRWFFVDTRKLALAPGSPISSASPALELRIMQTEIEAREIRDRWRFLRFAEAASAGAGALPRLGIEERVPDEPATAGSTGKDGSTSRL